MFGGISDQSIADTGSSNITGQPLLMSMAYLEFVFWIKREKERLSH